MRRGISSIAITDPLVKYRSLLATGTCHPDAGQHRLAIHLRKIYHRLKDYSPASEYRTRLKAITDALDRTKNKDDEDGSRTLAVESHPIWRNPLFAQFSRRNERRDTLALVRTLTSHEEAIQIDSPQGLFLSGEVGTGKSMLIDLLADGLPTSRKRRWHFNTFMLYTLSQLEHHRKSHQQLDPDDQEYSLLWMAKDMVEKSPILFLDEFQLPDKAASKILSNLFIAFFQLGGVLVASSNRMPEELEKATGIDYVPPTTSGLISRALGLRKTRDKGELFGSTSDFASFLEVLKARCEFWNMEGGKDWRRREVGESSNQYTKAVAEDTTSDDLSGTTVQVTSSFGVDTREIDEPGVSLTTPKNYFIIGEADKTVWVETLKNLASTSSNGGVPWESSTLTIYGRTITIPHQYDGTVWWNFHDLVSTFGPADYITMASTFHTFIIDDIPTLSVLKKNEARRLITLLDALYEARCKLLVRAEAGPDDLFFPETKAAPSPSPAKQGAQGGERVDDDAMHSETIAEAYQDTMSPFRPNISSYADSNNTDYDPDQDSDFGVEQKSKVDFSNTGAFTGEDERFAYKRATSRLWELCGARWHARTGDWWQPLPAEARHWEHSPASKPRPWPSMKSFRGSDGSVGPSVELEEPAGLQRLRIEQMRKAFSDEGDQKKSA
ncbi:AFG1-like ATPase-domain-containing protein [Annulohypoxylon bovei var. microspora]|nr:AFG1-like ATPase-domain-containing protein [Annulohypoxylon bovei var. microspora]